MGPTNEYSFAAMMIRRGRRQADRFHGDLHVIYVQQKGLTPADQANVEQNLAAAREVGARVETLREPDAVAAILRYAAAHGITQIFVGHSRKAGMLPRFKMNHVERLIQEAHGIDVRVFPRE